MDERAARPRVGFLIDRWEPARGGAERALVAFAEHLLERGYEVHAFGLRATPDAPGVFHAVEARGLTRARRELALARGSIEAARGAQCALTIGVRHLEEVDLYWPHAGSHGAALEARSRARGRSSFSAAHGRHKTFLQLERALLDGGGARLVACVSELVRDELSARHPACAERLRLCPNGVDLGHFHPGLREDCGARLRAELGLDDETPLLVFCARDALLKGLPTLYRALAELGARPWSLLVAGPRRAASWRRYARRLGLDPGRVELREDLEPRALHAAADVVVQPTWRDPCSLATLEALACGTPVITTEANGASELLRGAPPEVGQVVPAGEASALAAAIARQLDQGRPSLATQRASRRCVEARDASTTHAALEALLVELATGLS